jgi:hypothetical protein
MPTSWLRTLLLALTALLAVLHLPFPFSSDQALTFVGAQAVERGATLYVDWWDIRQPGAVWFYWLAGKLFGFSEFGVHLLELLWLGLAALVILATARRLVSRADLAALAPLLTIGMYYAWSSPWELTQAEGLAMLPLALCLLAVLRAEAAATPRGVAAFWMLFGFAAACAGLLKSVIVAIPLALAAAVALQRGKQRAELGGFLRHQLLPAGCGALAPIAAVLWHFWMRDALDELYWTTLTAPLLHLAELPRAPYRDLIASSAKFLAPWLPALPLWWMALRRLREPRRSPGLLLLAGWIAGAAAAILVQRYYYAGYHFLLLIVPLGLLAICGAEAALERSVAGGRWQPLSLLLLALLLVAAVPAGVKALALYRARAQPEGMGAAVRRILMPSYPAAQRAAAAISGESARPGAAFVFGDPMILAWSGRPQAIPLRGSSLYFTLPQHWDAYPRLLEAARPTYVFVGSNLSGELRSARPAIFALLDARYRISWSDESGSWYELAPSGAE